MSLRESFTRNIYWPLVQKIKGEFAVRALNELFESQWKTRDELFSDQWQLVRHTVNKAAREVPYYRKTFKRLGWDFGNRNFSYADFSHIPKVEKEDLRDNLPEFLNPNYMGRVTSGSTSGSSGCSLRLLYDTVHESYSEAGRWRAKDWWGIRPGSPHVSIWGRPFNSYKDRLNQKAKRARHIAIKANPHGITLNKNEDVLSDLSFSRIEDIAELQLFERSILFKSTATSSIC